MTDETQFNRETEGEEILQYDGLLGLPDPEQNCYTDKRIRESLSLLRCVSNPDSELLRSALEVYKQSTRDAALKKELENWLSSL